jgi:diacylglycerol kinase (ATP)
MKPSRVMVVANPHAGRREAILGTLQHEFKAAEIEWNVAFTNGPKDAHRLAMIAAEQGYDCVAACGGDGTVMEVAAGMVGSEAVLAILPVGTGNVSAMELGIPPSLVDATHLIASGAARTRSVDMGRAGDHTFLLRMGVGFEAAIKAHTNAELKHNFRAFAYVLSSLETLFTLPVSEYTIIVDGLTVERSGVACIVANSGLTGIGGIELARGISISDGLLDVVVVSPASLQMLMGAASAVFTEERSPFEHWQGRSITVRSSPSREVTCDGEDAGLTPIDVKVMPAAIRVLVPSLVEVVTPAEADARIFAE